MLMNLGFAGSGAAAAAPTVPTTPSQTYAAIYRRSFRILIPFLLLIELLEKVRGR